MNEILLEDNIPFPIPIRMPRNPEEAKRKLICRSYARTYLSRGKLRRANCQTCGNAKSEMHHSDYSKPLEVIWLCRKCHLALHH